MLARVISYFAWFVSFASVIGSLSFSEIMHFPPCALCWYQRVLLFPICLVITVGILRKDKNYIFYVLPLSILGIPVALYHTLLQQGIIKESLAPCLNGISCATKYFDLFGFITIPFLSLLVFISLFVSMLILLRIERKGGLK